MTQLRVLFIITDYGDGNRRYRDRLLGEVFGLPYDVSVELLSDTYKQETFDPRVKLRVGIPGRSPWTLPFAYKKLLWENRDSFDLFVYVENDILVTHSAIQSFLDAASEMPADRIPGFTRYELDRTGARYYIDIFRHFRFKPGSAVRYGSNVYAELSNLHAGCFMLTRAHLARALRSPTFLRPPSRGEYDYAETAATEPYTQCGLTKVICVNRLDAFALHHLPNKYYSRPEFNLADEQTIYRQCKRLCESLEQGKVDQSTLFNTHPPIASKLWDKNVYATMDLFARRLLLASERSTILSIGAGNGATEIALARNGLNVSAIPLDSISSVSMADAGINILPISLTDALQGLGSKKFDFILLCDVLQYLPEPAVALRQILNHVADNGKLLIQAPHFFNIRLIRRLVNRDISITELLRLIRSGGSFHLTSRRKLGHWIKNGGFIIVQSISETATFANSRLVNILTRLLPTSAEQRYSVIAAKGPGELRPHRCCPSSQ